MRLVNLVGKRYGMLTVLNRASYNKGKNVVWMCQCDCGNVVDKVGSYLKIGDTQSCGCYKKQVETENLRSQYEAKRVDGVVKPLFKGQEPRKDSSTGYRGVSRYYTRKSKELRYRAWITVMGECYYKSGFMSAEDAYNIGRVELENKYLPKGDSND